MFDLAITRLAWAFNWVLSSPANFASTIFGLIAIWLFIEILAYGDPES